MVYSTKLEMITPHLRVNEEIPSPLKLRAILKCDVDRSNVNYASDRIQRQILIAPNRDIKDDVFNLSTY